MTNEYFVTGAQGGELALWFVGKKKAVGSVPEAHGAMPTWATPLTDAAPVGSTPAKQTGTVAAPIVSRACPHITSTSDPPPSLSSSYSGAWISSMAVMPASDLMATGSGDGLVRLWRLGLAQNRGMRGGAVASTSASGIQALTSIPVVWIQ